MTLRERFMHEDGWGQVQGAYKSTHSVCRRMSQGVWGDEGYKFRVLTLLLCVGCPETPGG